MSDARKLNIVDEGGNIIGTETRENIHKQGLLHREIHVWFYTPKGEIIFQHRSKNKDTFPDLLDATVGGHVEAGAGYENTAIKEVAEETGTHITKDNLIFIKLRRSNAHDQVTGMTNNALRAVFAYRYDGRIEDLKIEDDKAVGFEAWPFEKIFNLSDKDRQRFIPTILSAQNLEIFHKIQEFTS